MATLFVISLFLVLLFAAVAMLGAISRRAALHSGPEDGVKHAGGSRKLRWFPERHARV